MKPLIMQIVTFFGNFAFIMLITSLVWSIILFFTWIGFGIASILNSFPSYISYSLGIAIAFTTILILGTILPN